MKYKEKLVESGKTIRKLELEIKQLKKEKLKLLEEQEEKGILQLKEEVEFYKEFIDTLKGLLWRYSFIERK